MSDIEMPNIWIDALKKWNADKGGPWCVPRKGTKEYDQVKKIMSGPVKRKRPIVPEDVKEKFREENEREKKEKEDKASKKQPKKKADPLSSYLKGYTGSYQDYEDSNGNEVIYPTSDIKQIIRLAYKGTSFDEIVREVGYNKIETATMIYDHFISRGDIDVPKEYPDEEKVMAVMKD